VGGHSGEAVAEGLFRGWVVVMQSTDGGLVEDQRVVDWVVHSRGLEGGDGLIGFLVEHVVGGQEARDEDLVGVKGELLLEVGDGFGGVVVLHGEEAVVAPQECLFVVQRFSLVEELAGSLQVFALLRLVDLADEVGSGGIVFHGGGCGGRGSVGGGGDELDVGFAVEARVLEPLVVGLPLRGGDVLLDDLDLAIGGEDAVLELVGFVEGGKGGFGVDGGWKVGGPAFGQRHDGVVGLEVGQAELDGGDGGILFVDVREAGGGKLRDDAEVVPVAILVALIVVGDVEGNDGVVGAGELGVGDLATEGHAVGDALHEVVPLGGRDGADGLGDGDFVIAAEVHDDVGVGGALVIEGADGLEGVERWKRRIFGGGFDVGIAGGGNDEGLLAADDGVEQAERRDFGGGVEPDGLAVDVGEGDGVVERGRGGDGGVEGDAGSDEDGVCVDAGGGEHGDEEGGLVLAVSVLVVEDVAGLVGLEAADAEGYTDVTDLGAYIGVDGAGFLVRGGLSGDEGGDLGTDIVVRLDAGAFEGVIPGADFLPAMEVGPGDLREGRVVAGAEGGIVVELEEGVPVLAGGGCELGALPAVDAFGGGVGESGFVVGAPDLDVGVFGDVELDAFRAHDDAGGGEEEAFAAPEVAGDFWLGADDADLVLEEIAGLEAADGDLLLLDVAIEGGFAGDFGGELLGVGGRGGDDGAVGVVDADVVDLDVLGAGGEVEGKNAEGFDAGLVANLDDSGDLAGAGAVGCEGVDPVEAVEDDGFAGIVGGGGAGLGGGGGWEGLGACDSEARGEERGGEEHRNPDFHDPSYIADKLAGVRFRMSCGGASEGDSVVAPAASPRPSAEWWRLRRWLDYGTETRS
jgi:hypothetical protein